jgi:dolichol-phosphate mannosyltransferase
MPEIPELPSIIASPLSIVLPAYNDAAHLEQVVRDWIGYLDGLARPYHIFLIDDGSTDRTGELADELAQKYPRIQVLRHPTRRGYGAALRTALPLARDPLLATSTCDPQYRPSDLKLLLKDIDQVHLVSGGRSSVAMPPWLRTLGRVYRGAVRVLLGIPLEPRRIWRGWRGQASYWLVRLLLGLRTVDAGSPFKLYRRVIFPRIPIQSDGPFAHVEILAKADFLGFLMSEVPVPHQPLAERDRPSVLPDARRVFAHPDFGPAVLPEQTKG